MSILQTCVGRSGEVSTSPHSATKKMCWCSNIQGLLFLPLLISSLVFITWTPCQKHFKLVFVGTSSIPHTSDIYCGSQLVNDTNNSLYRLLKMLKNSIYITMTMIIKKGYLYFFCFFIREFLGLLQRYKSFFLAVPEMLCEGESVVEDSYCWGGDGVVKR